MKEATCPTCRQKLISSGLGRPSTFPFCSERCRNVDLAGWFDEKFTVPVETERVARELLSGEGQHDELEQ